MSSRTRGWHGALLFCCVLGCSRDDESLDLAAAMASARPHASKFGGYESWVMRAWSVADPNSNDQALLETLFAPVRNDSEIAGTWIAVPGTPRRVLALPTKTEWPDSRGWTQVRDPLLGLIRVANLAQCPFSNARKQVGKVDHQACVVIARDPDQMNDREPAIAMAFSSPSR